MNALHSARTAIPGTLLKVAGHMPGVFVCACVFMYACVCVFVCVCIACAPPSLALFIRWLGTCQVCVYVCMCVFLCVYA
jgi:hypothetical protein